MSSLTAFPSLRAAPINEVVCGFIFDLIQELSPVSHGAYWERRRNDFPSHSVHPPISDEPLEIELLPLRTWLISGDQTRLVQVQHDRLFVNWRRLGHGQYPRFSTHGDQPGHLAFALNEFTQFQAFCKDRLQHPLQLRAVELSKIDILAKGEAWNSADDLGDFIPLLKGLVALGPKTTGPAFAVQFADGTDGSPVVVNLNIVKHQGTQNPAVRIETRLRLPADKNPEGVFNTLNHKLNSTFFRLLSRQAVEKFGPEQGGQ